MRFTQASGRSSHTPPRRRRRLQGREPRTGTDEGIDACDLRIVAVGHTACQCELQAGGLPGPQAIRWATGRPLHTEGVRQYLTCVTGFYLGRFPPNWAREGDNHTELVLCRGRRLSCRNCADLRATPAAHRGALCRGPSQRRLCQRCMGAGHTHWRSRGPSACAKRERAG